MASHTVKDTVRISVPLTKEDAEWPPTSAAMTVLNMERSDVQGHVRIWLNNEWYLLAVGVMANALFTLCPFDGPSRPAAPPLRPIR